MRRILYIIVLVSSSLACGLSTNPALLTVTETPQMLENKVTSAGARPGVRFAPPAPAPGVTFDDLRDYYPGWQFGE